MLALLVTQKLELEINVLYSKSSIEKKGNTAE